MSNYRRIMYEDRCQIYALSKRGASQESIAEVLGVSQSAVSREMRRNRGQRGYRFKQAEAKAQARQAIRSNPRKLTAPLRRKIEAKLRQMRWSPEQISGGSANRASTEPRMHLPDDLAGQTRRRRLVALSTATR